MSFEFLINCTSCAGLTSLLSALQNNATPLRFFPSHLGYAIMLLKGRLETNSKTKIVYIYIFSVALFLFTDWFFIYKGGGSRHENNNKMEITLPLERQSFSDYFSLHRNKRYMSYPLYPHFIYSYMLKILKLSVYVYLKSP